MLVSKLTASQLALSLIFLTAVETSFANTNEPPPVLPDVNTAQSLQDLFHGSVLNGQLSTAQSETSKFTVMIESHTADNKPQGWCTGIVFRKDIILTAAHCLYDNTKYVKVKFGLGGANGFHYEENSRHFKWYNSQLNRTATREGGPTNYYDIDFDEKTRSSYEATIKARTAWENFSNSDIVRFSDFGDFAVIRIKNLPTGYKPIEVLKGELKFRATAYGTGYGVNSRKKSENSLALRWAKFELVGHYTRNGEVTVGWQAYSPTRQQVCFGDSGGPLVTKIKDQYFLVGINGFTFNNCANSNWYVGVHYYINQILEYIKIVRSMSDT